MKPPSIPAEQSKYKGRSECCLSVITEYGIHLYVFMLLFDKGEGLRTIGLYGALISWLILTFSMKKVTLSHDIITYGFLVFLTSTIVSSFFSIDPFYSLSYFKRDILKSAITFFIISSYFDTRMLLRLRGVICFSSIIILTLGLHSLRPQSAYALSVFRE